MRETFLPFSPLSFGEEEIVEVVDSLRSGWITTGPKVRRFEQEFARYVGAPTALAVSSGTGAMQVGLAALGVGPGDEVITTPMTFCSGLHVIEHLGARPVLADVEPDTLNIAPEAAAKAVTSKTKVLLPVHLYGHPCQMDALVDLAAERSLFILEDAAHSLPARYKGRMIGTIGTLTCFSFYATKNLTTAEGGMLTGAPELIDKARIWSQHGMGSNAYKRYSAEGSWHYDVVVPGFKANMTDIQAALGLWQLKKLDRFQERRRAIVEHYNSGLSSCDAVQLPGERADVESAWHLYPIRLRLEMLTINRSRFIDELAARRIGTSVHFVPNHIQPYYRDKYGYKPEDFPVAYREYKRLISLPLNLVMTDQDVGDVIEAVCDVARAFRK